MNVNASKRIQGLAQRGIGTLDNPTPIHARFALGPFGLLLDLGTDSSIPPQAALQAAARRLRDSLEPYASPGPDAEAAAAAAGPDLSHLPRLLGLGIDALGLSVRASHALAAARIRLIGDLVQCTEVELLRTPHLGRKCLHEIKGVLAAHGFVLGTPVPGWPPASA